jgi:hypothetical protein
MSLSDLLTNAQSNTVSLDDPKWFQFVLDHLDYIKARSTVFAIDAPLMNLYRYDLRRFLKVYMKRHEDIGGIVQLLNGIKNDFEFAEPRNLIIPEDSLITKLYHSYVTVNANAS